jgi:hypothetical protein
MPTKTGTVSCLQVAEFAAFTTVVDLAGVQETFILWFNPGAQIPPVLNSFTRVLHSMWVSLLREAISNGTVVSVSHPTGSAAVEIVRLG